MNRTEKKYNKYSLVREMMEPPGIIRSFDPLEAGRFTYEAASGKGLFLTEEGSSRFPAKRAIYASLEKGSYLPVITEGGTQAEEYLLYNYAVFAASNSGKTKEIIHLVARLREKNHNAVFGLMANQRIPNWKSWLLKHMF